MIFKFRDPEPEQLNKMSDFGEAAQMDPGMGQLDEMSDFCEAAQMDPGTQQLDNGLTKRESLRVVQYQKYLKTKQRIATLKKQFRDYNNVNLFLPMDIFRPHTGGAIHA